MALKKAKETSIGVTADYWRIDNIVVDKKNKEGGITVHLYINSTVKDPIDTYIISLTADKIEKNSTERFDTYFGSKMQEDYNVYKAGYECIKNTEEYFKDAVDC